MHDAKDPTALLIAGRHKRHTQADDGPECDDSNCRAHAVGRDFHANLAAHDRQTQDGGNDDRQAHSSVENKIDAIALDAHDGLSDEVKYGAANRRANQRGVE